VVLALPWRGDVHSADHRDAPLSSEDPAADVNDVFAFVSPTDVKFPTNSAVPGSGALDKRRALDCSVLPACPDRRLAVLQGTDFIKPDAQLGDLSTSGNDRPFRTAFPFIGESHPLPGSLTPAPGTVGFPPQQ
jgi:hypothetical protein